MVVIGSRAQEKVRHLLKTSVVLLQRSMMISAGTSCYLMIRMELYHSICLDLFVFEIFLYLDSRQWSQFLRNISQIEPSPLFVLDWVWHGTWYQTAS
jgi:hypothetical protein